MQIKDVMTRDVRIAQPDQSIRQAAQTMLDLDVGVLPVGENDRLVGMITDRDIAVRGVAKGCGPDAKVREVMSTQVMYCYEDEAVDHVAQNMAEIQVRRLPVLDRDKRLVGIVSVGDMSLYVKPDETGQALRGISRPGGQHDQSEQATHAPAGAA